MAEPEPHRDVSRRVSESHPHPLACTGAKGSGSKDGVLPGHFNPRQEQNQSSNKKCARAVAIGWERDFCQAVIITLATRLP